MKGANAAVDILLRGNAVNYALTAQDASGLKFGDQAQTQPPQIAHDLIRLKAKGARIFVVEDALRERGIDRAELIDGLDLIPRQRLARLYGEYDQVWQW
jgi:sulfur relay (sulfurtransferase) DsrF/TusC family protein